MKYNYYPGCSLERNASAYHDSTIEVAKVLDVQFEEIEDWNCCGATEYMSLDLLPAYALVGRNLAIAAKNRTNGSDTLVAPCSACYLNLCKVNRAMADSKQLSDQVNLALAAGGLSYKPDTVRVRHSLEVFYEDIGATKIKEKVTRPLYDLRVAPYYGCLIVRPAYNGAFDDPEYPISLDQLMMALDAEVVDFPLKAHCCGGHMTQISEEVALELIRRLLKNAQDYEADVLVTLCPMCQLNLDGYQAAVNKHFGTDFHIPILYYTQLMGLAFGVNPKKLGFGKEIISADKALSKIGVEPPPKPKRHRASKDELPMPSMPKEV